MRFVRGVPAIFAVWAGVLCVLPGSVRGQGVQALGDPMTASSSVVIASSSLVVQLDAPSRSVPERKEEWVSTQDPMESFGVGLRLGVGFTPSMDLETPVTGASPMDHIAARVGLRVALPIHLGDGHGLGVDLEPFLFRYGRPVLMEGASGHALEVGGYVGPAIRAQVRGVYVSLGLGAKLGWLVDEQLDFGLDLFGRVPLSVTYYMNETAALTVELGLGYGVTGVKDKPEVLGVMLDPDDSLADAVAWRFGNGFSTDFSLGLRFP